MSLSSEVIEACVHSCTTEAYNALLSALCTTGLREDQVQEVKFALFGFSNVRRDVTELRPTSELAQQMTQRLEDLGWEIIDVVSKEGSYFALLAREISLVEGKRVMFVNAHGCELSTENIEAMKPLPPLSPAPEAFAGLEAAAAFEECTKEYHHLKAVLYKQIQHKFHSDSYLHIYYDQYETLIQTLLASLDLSNLTDAKVYRWIKRRRNEKMKTYDSLKQFPELPSDKELSTYWNQWFTSHPEEMETTDDETESIVRDLGLTKLRE